MFRAQYYRTSFVVNDLEQAKELSLSLRYRGGVRVLVNGQEIARGHLPAGAMNAELTPRITRARRTWRWEDEIQANVKDQVNHCSQGIADLRCDWEEAAPTGRKGEESFRTNCMGRTSTRRDGSASRACAIARWGR